MLFRSSVSDQACSQFFAEIDQIYRCGTEISVIQCDAAVQNVSKYNPNTPVKIYGRGGTLYTPGIKAAVDEGVDAIVYFGDMDSADTPKDPGIPVLWVTVGSDKKPGNFGKLISITL